MAQMFLLWTACIIVAVKSESVLVVVGETDVPIQNRWQTPDGRAIPFSCGEVGYDVVPLCCPSLELVHITDGRFDVGSGCLKADDSFQELTWDQNELVARGLAGICEPFKFDVVPMCCSSLISSPSGALSYDQHQCYTPPEYGEFPLEEEKEMDPGVLFECDASVAGISSAAVCCTTSSVQGSGNGTYHAGFGCLSGRTDEDKSGAPVEWLTAVSCGPPEMDYTGLCCRGMPDMATIEEGVAHSVSDCSLPSKYPEPLPMESSNDDKVHFIPSSPTAFSCESFNDYSGSPGGRLAVCCPKTEIFDNGEGSYNTDYGSGCTYINLDPGKGADDISWKGSASWHDCGLPEDSEMQGLCCSGAAYGEKLDGTMTLVSDCMHPPGI